MLVVFEYFQIKNTTFIARLQTLNERVRSFDGTMN